MLQRSPAIAVLGAASVVVSLVGAIGCTRDAAAPAGGAARFEISYAGAAEAEPLDGRLLLMLARRETPEPRFQTNPGLGGAQVFGIDVDGWLGGEPATIDAAVFGFPNASLSTVPAGDYWVQAVLHRYDTFERAVGPPVKLPMDRGEGQNWRRSPGNLYSTPRLVSFDPAQQGVIEITLDQVIPTIEEPEDTQSIRHVKIRSALLSEFWGRDMFLGAHVLLPHGFDEYPEARYPLMVFHGHYPADLGGFRTEPPDSDLECEYSERFQVDCYNRVQQEEAYAFYQRWISPGFPRYLVIEIQHQNPYYDDSYAVNSANLGPYGDAIMHELVPYVEEQFRGIGEGWARFTYGGSTGGWEALAAQMFYPDDFNGAFVACPDPIDFRAYTLIDLYSYENAYDRQGDFKTIEIPGHRNWLGEVDITVRDYNLYELVLGENGRSGDQWDIWQAVYSPMGEDGYPQPIWNKLTGEIDQQVAAHWRENYDLRYILERDWATLGPKLEGKLHIYVGDMDNYYLNNAVYLMESFLESTTDPYYAGEVDYGDRAEHCWNGDQANPNHISRLRYNTMYLPKILNRIEKTAPPGADLTSWRH
ncbi:MAG TPA: hypothetical protein VMT85_15515 [Thermoanaerobaculia bacterium]|nr:hypothetical protein [Thermoanaerobaculia bacterium]